MRRVIEHLDSLNSIRLKRAVEDEEPSKHETALNILSVELVDLVLLDIAPFVAKGEDSASPLREPTCTLTRSRPGHQRTCF